MTKEDVYKTKKAFIRHKEIVHKVWNTKLTHTGKDEKGEIG